jgi:hypothetical protein
MGVLM